MNALLKKEIRLLLPTFVFAAATTLASIFFHDQTGSWVNGVGYFLGGIFTPAIVIMLALNTFGVEVGTQTFSMMLAQPVERQRIWQTKITLLALAMVAVGLIWYLSVAVPAQYYHRYQRVITREDQADILASFVLFGMVVFSGALWTVLLLRQVAAAFWFTLIAPGALLAIVAACCSGSSDEFILGMIATVLGLYSLAGFFFARWLFFRAQDLQWSGGSIVMPEFRSLARFKAAAGTVRMWRPRVALWKKDIQLQQSQLVVAFALAVLHLGVLAVRKFCDLHNSRDLKFVLEGFWGVWLVMPLLVGCAAVAEERKLGMHEGQLCLPAKRRKQFFIKFLVVIGLSVLLGVLMPLLLEGGRILPDAHIKSTLRNCLQLFVFPGPRADFAAFARQTLIDCLPLLVLPGIAALTGAISFYISTMARNTLQTLAPAILGILLVWPLIFFAAGSWNNTYPFLWRGPLGCFIVLPILALTMLLLAFRNFQCMLTGWTMTTRNLLALVASLAVGVVITSAVYHRFWEKFTRFEPPHGPARLSVSHPASLTLEWGTTSVRLPDGRIWTGLLSPNLSLANFKMKLTGGEYVSGTNWMSVKQSYWGIAGLKSDGTLWISQNPPATVAPARLREYEWQNLVQSGSESNWVSFQPNGDSLLLIKKDGTLWRLRVGLPEYHPFSKNRSWPGPLAFTPQQIGTESNWTEMFRVADQICLLKTDCSCWVAGAWGDWQTDTPSIEIEPGFVVQRVPALDHNQMRSTTFIAYTQPLEVGVRNDGTFRVWAEQRLIPVTHNTYRVGWCPTDLQIGTGTNWLAMAAAANGQKAVTLKSDGTLWLWDFRPRKLTTLNTYNAPPWEEIAKTIPVQLGKHSDWIAIGEAPANRGVVALAADGSLWFWPLMNDSQPAAADTLPYENADQHWIPFLDISRKPQLLANVFSAAN